MDQHGAVLPISQDRFLMQVSQYLMKHSVENLDLSVHLLREDGSVLKLHGSTN